MTAEEFARLHGGDNVELIKGQVRELPMPFPKHGKICNNMAFELTVYTRRQDLGHVMSNDSFVRIRSNPDTVRGADLSYYSFERLPKGPIPSGLLPVSPDLIVEVRSPSDRWAKVLAKVAEYLEAGVRAVIVLDDASGSAIVFRPEELQQIFHNGDELVVPEVLPGFAVPVQRLFE
jgi:Uma2 family endonuclease